MNPELWHNISIVFLIIGIIFFAFTVLLSVKFHLISIIQSEISNRKERKNSGEENDYFALSKNDNSKNEINNTVSAPRQTYSPASQTVPAPQQTDSPTSHTVLAPQQTDSPASHTVLVSAENIDYEKNNDDNDDFVIFENIIVIHGDPF